MKRARQLVSYFSKCHDTDIFLKDGETMVTHSAFLASESKPLAAMLQSEMTERVGTRAQLKFPAMSLGAWFIFERWATGVEHEDYRDWGETPPTEAEFMEAYDFGVCYLIRRFQGVLLNNCKYVLSIPAMVNLADVYGHTRAIDMAVEKFSSLKGWQPFLVIDNEVYNTGIIRAALNDVHVLVDSLKEIAEKLPQHLEACIQVLVRRVKGGEECYAIRLAIRNLDFLRQHRDLKEACVDHFAGKNKSTKEKKKCRLLPCSPIY